jgi:hypothetical protein
MAKSKADYIEQGRADAAAGGARKIGFTRNSWQENAYDLGFNAEYKRQVSCPACAAGVPLAAPVLAKVVGGPDDGKVVQLTAKAVQAITRTAGETLDAGRQAHAAQVTRMATEHRRADRIDRMTRGYIAAALGSSGGTTPEGEELESLEGYEFSDESKSKAWGICAAFYDRYTTDVNAYAGTYKPGNGADPYEHAGHDLWLTSGGHGVGFWDRGLGNLGDRLSKACGFRTDFPEKWVDIGDDHYVHLD